MIWYDVEPDSAILECAACDYLIVSGNFNDEVEQRVATAPRSSPRT